jgi:hypothetical protein
MSRVRPRAEKSGAKPTNASPPEAGPAIVGAGQACQGRTNYPGSPGLREPRAHPGRPQPPREQLRARTPTCGPGSGQRIRPSAAWSASWCEILTTRGAKVTPRTVTVRNHPWSGGRPRQESNLRSRLRRPVLNVRRGFLSALECNRDPSPASVQSRDSPVRRRSPHEPHHERAADPLPALGPGTLGWRSCRERA